MKITKSKSNRKISLFASIPDDKFGEDPRTRSPEIAHLSSYIKIVIITWIPGRRDGIAYNKNIENKMKTIMSA